MWTGNCLKECTRPSSRPLRACRYELLLPAPPPDRAHSAAVVGLRRPSGVTGYLRSVKHGNVLQRFICQVSHTFNVAKVAYDCLLHASSHRLRRIIVVVWLHFGKRLV